MEDRDLRPDGNSNSKIGLQFFEGNGRSIFLRRDRFTQINKIVSIGEYLLERDEFVVGQNDELIHAILFQNFRMQLDHKD